MAKPVLVVGSGHLALRIGRLAATRGYQSLRIGNESLSVAADEGTPGETLARVVPGIELTQLAAVFLVDERDDQNLASLIALLSVDPGVPIVASLFNEQVAAHLQAAHPRVRVLNPARIAAPAFVQALRTPITHTLRYTPTRPAEELPAVRGDRLILGLVAVFTLLLAGATAFFHASEDLSWLDAAYFVVVTVATVGYGDISLLESSAASKVAGIALILASTVFIWMIFSLTVDHIIKRRVQLALGRKRYSHSGHIILCGLGRLGHFVAEGLLQQGERVLVVEKNAEASTADFFRARGADVYIGDARLPRVLQDIGVSRAKALYSVVNDDFVNLEIGLNARSRAPDLRLVLRIFDAAVAQRVKEHLDIHLTLSMSAIADDAFLAAIQGG